MPPLLTVPGLEGSGPAHWQSLWEGLFPTARRVEQRDWHAPEREAWVAALEAAVAACPAPPVLVAHSLGCDAVVHWAARHGGAGGARRARGALLVAPPDLEAPGLPPALHSFRPVPLAPLPFPSLLVASRDDPWARWEASEALARAWGSRLVDAGRAGHLNGASGLGAWPAGQVLLRTLFQGGTPA
jgi:predicted alpha/beta hydrolase family esterase